MGGLKKDLPITYWTFVIGAVAIAGIPPFAGFFSKDEILFRTYAERPHAALGRRPAHGAADRDLHVPPRLHDLPRAFERVGRKRAPSHADHADTCGPQVARDPSARRAAGDGRGPHRARARVGGRRLGRASAAGSSTSSSRALARWPQSQARLPKAAPETTLMIVSVVVALAGIGIAAYFFLKNRPAADRVAEQFSGVHTRALEQVLRRRNLRRRRRAAHPHHLGGRVVEGRGHRRDRPHGQRRRPARSAAAARCFAACRPGRCAPTRRRSFWASC